MAKSFPKYVRKRGQHSLQYRRKLQGIGGEFSRAMTANQDSPESEIQREATHCTKLYELELKTKAATSVDLMDDMDIETAATELLRKLSIQDSCKYEGGTLHPAQIVTIDHGNGEVVHEDVSVDIANELLGINDLIDLTRSGGIERELTAQEEIEFKVMNRAREALLKPRKTPPRYLSQCLDWYCTNRKDAPDWPLEGREYNRRRNRFLDILKHIGDCLTEDPAADKLISKGLEAYAYERTQDAVKGQTINRDMKGSLAAFRRVSKYFKLGWVIEVPEISEAPAAEREVLTDEEQEALVRWCLKTNDKFSAILLAQFHSGLMATEVKRLGEDPEENIVLDGSTPYLLIKHTTKKEQRKRIVPLVLGLGVIQRHLGEGIQWLNSSTESNHSHILKSKLYSATGNPRVTAHCLRHTWNCNATGMDVNLIHRALIAGWASAGRDAAFTQEMLRYGRTGLQRVKIVQALADTQRKIFAHLLHLEGGDGAKKASLGNVVSINSRT